MDTCVRAVLSMPDRGPIEISAKIVKEKWLSGLPVALAGKRGSIIVLENDHPELGLRGVLVLEDEYKRALTLLAKEK